MSSENFLGRLKLTLLSIRMKPRFVKFGSENQFHPEAIAKYEEALLAAEREGSRVRAIILCVSKS